MPDKRLEALPVEELSERLRGHGLRVTGPRLIVYQALADMEQHASAEEIAAQVAERGLVLPKTSVYNALKALADANLVTVVDISPGPTLFEIVTAPHHHFVCRICGSITDIPDAHDVSKAVATALPGAIIESAQLVLRGVCPTCSKKLQQGPVRVVTSSKFSKR